MTGADKINELLRYLDISPSDFAKMLNLKHVQNIYDIQKGRIDISKAMAAKITTALPELSQEWLLTGTGQMLKSIGTVEEPKSRYGKEGNDLSLLIDYLKEKDGKINELHGEIRQLVEDKSRLATLLEMEKRR